MKVKVTQEHIDKGRRCNAHCCPIALALSDAGLDRPFVVGSRVMLEGYEVGLPMDAYNFIDKFDRDLEPTIWEPKPFEFSIDPKSY